jgi:hypothetical protein
MRLDEIGRELVRRLEESLSEEIGGKFEHRDWSS